MNQAFYELSQEKQDKILSAAFTEFAGQGYEHASTNQIVSAAGISKGLLFYYFNSKEELFNDLIDLGLKYFRKNYLEKIDLGRRDFLQRLADLAVLKAGVMRANPPLVKFFFRIISGGEKNIYKPHAAQITEFTAESARLVYADLDTSHFRKDISEARLRSMIQWCLDGYVKDMTERLQQKNGDEILNMDYWSDFYKLLDELKLIFYT